MEGLLLGPQALCLGCEKGQGYSDVNKWHLERIRAYHKPLSLPLNLLPNPGGPKRGWTKEWAGKEEVSSIPSAGDREHQVSFS